MNELTIAIRHLVRRPAFAVLGIFALGAGLAAAILVFGVLNTLMLRPLPGINVDGDRLVEIGRDSGGRLDSMSFPLYLDLQERAVTLDAVYAYGLTPAYLLGEGVSHAALAMVVSGNYFDALGVQAAHGQLFEAVHDEVPRRDPVAVLSHGAFQRYFGGDAARIGETLRINGVGYTVLGVTAPEFRGHIAALAPEIFVPLAMAGAMQWTGDAAREQRGSYWLMMGGRLAPGATLDQARAELATLSVALAPLGPNNQNPPTVGVANLRPTPQAAHGIVGFLGAGLMVMCAAILALACANLAGVLLAQGEARGPELAMRSALGASRARIARQLLIEAALVAVAAAAVGLVLASIGKDVLNLLPLPAPYPIDLGVVIDARVVAFAAFAALSVTLAFGLVPALKLSAGAPVTALAGSGGTVGRALGAGRPWLLAVQSALTVALLLVAALTWQALGRAAAIDTGFRIDQVHHASADVGPLGLSSAEAAARLEQAMARLREHPGVEHASFATVVPLTMHRSHFGVARLPADSELLVEPDSNTVGEGFFELFGLAVRGRAINAGDTADKPAVVVVNAEFARRLFGDTEPLGREFEIGGGEDWRRVQVVGVVGDGRYSNLSDTGRPFAFWSAPQWERNEFEIFVHGPIAANSLRTALADELRQVLPDLPPPEVQRFADQAALSVLPQRILGAAAGALGLLALVLAATGIYGVLALQIERRFREFGVRRALGASGSQIATALVRRIIVWLAIGVAVGVLLAQGMAAALGSLLFDVSGADPVALLATIAAFGLMAVAAIVAPLARALRLQPMDALRYE